MRVAALLRRAWVVLLMLPLQGCPPPEASLGYNNSGQDLAVVLTDRTLSWPRGTTLLLKDEHFRKMTSVKAPAGDFQIPLLEVTADGRTSRYAWWCRILDERFVSIGPPRQTYWQLEADGSLYVVLPSNQWPTAVPPQPPSCPVRPG